MSEVLIYFIRTSLLTGICYGIYFVLLRKNTFHHLNRYALLFFLLFSALAPLIPTGFSSEIKPINTTIWLDEYQDVAQTAPDLIATPPSTERTQIITFVLMFYLLGVAVFLVRFLKQLVSLFRLRKRAVNDEEGFRIVFSDSVLSAFSFMGYIYLPSHQQSDNNRLIIEHEKVHIRQLHSLDLIVSEFFCILFWYNPFVFLFRRSIKTVHEYLADSMVMHNSSSRNEYLNLLLSNIQHALNYSFASQFKSLTIQKRIEMITKNKTHNYRRLVYLAILPVVFILFQAFSQNSDEGNNIPSIRPLKSDAKYKITSEFGMREHPITHEMKMHYAVDFSAKTGTPVVATADGIVVEMEFLEEHKGYGRKLVIRHNSTYSTAYTQLSAFNVQLEQKVKQGDVIGFVGESGLATGPHLHYEVWKDGERVNPQEYFE